MAKKKKKEKFETEEVLQSLEQTAHRTEGFLEKNAKILGYIFGGLILVAVGYFAYLNFYKEPRNKEATNEMVQADTYFDQDSMALALNGSPGAYMGLNQIAEDYSGTDAGNLANYKAAIASYQTGDYQAAVDKFNSFSTDEEALKAMKFGGLGDAQVQLGQKDQALTSYEKAINASNIRVIQKIFVQKAAILSLDLGNFDKGIQLIESFKDKNDLGDTDADIEKLLARLTYAKG